MPSAQSVFTALEALRDVLGAVSGVQTSKVGLESNMTPADYPMVRVVPSRISNAGTLSRRRTECLVYFGQPVHEFEDGLEALHENMLTLEAALITAAQTSNQFFCDYIETVVDEDRVDGYKLMALRLAVEV